MEAVDAFLAREGEHGPTVDLALGALREDGALIGVAVLGVAPTKQAPATIAVATAHRRLHVGSDLLHALTAEAAAREVQCLKVTYDGGAVAPDGFVRSCGLMIGRRVANGTVAAVLRVPRQD